MITVYDKKETSFTHNGLGVLDKCHSCKIIERLNGIYELQLSYPLHLAKTSLLQPFNIIKADGQLFRVYHVEKDSKAMLVQVNARHIFYDLAHYFIEDRRAVNRTCLAAMEIIIDEIDLVGKYTVASDIGETATQYMIRKNASDAMLMIVNRWRGELMRDNFHIQIRLPKAYDQGATVQYGKNVMGINEKVNADEVITAIYPVGANALTLSEKYLINPLWDGDLYPDFKMIKNVEFKDAEDENTLRNLAQSYLNEHASFGLNYQVDFIQLEHTAEYENYASLLQVKVGDTVTVRHKLMGLDFKIKVISIEKDLLRAQNTKVELGKPLYTLDQYIEDLQRNVDSGFEQVDSSIGGIRSQLDNLGVSYTVVKSLSMNANHIDVTYEVEHGTIEQFHAQYSYTTDTAGRINNITLEGIFSEFLLKEVAQLSVDAARFEVIYVDGTTATYAYTTDTGGRISGIEKIS